MKKSLLESTTGPNNNIRERQPLRAEIYTKEKMEQHAASLAKKHVLVTQFASEQLLKRLAENEQILLEVYAVITKKIKEEKRISPGAEWLLDNFYLIEENIYAGKKHLPKGYSKTLPRLAKGESAGLPRVYNIAVEIISHSDGHLNLFQIASFIRAYQNINPLKIGELWAIPIMLRLALLENLRRLSILVAEELSNKSLANYWADEMIETVKKNPKDLVLILADMARSKPPMESSFVAELLRRLQEKGHVLSLPINWMEQGLMEIGLSSSELVQQDNQNQAASQVSISNSIKSLRFLNITDWRDFVENNSVVEEILQQDLLGVYKKMDFNTRDKYRHSIEKIARSSKLTEQEVAAMVLRMAKEKFADINASKKSHVGYYLSGKGLAIATLAAKRKISIIDKCIRFKNNNLLFLYLGSIFLLTGLISSALLLPVLKNINLTGILISVAILLVIATSHLAVDITNWLSTLLVKPDLLPRMDYSKGVPDSARTLVVIPTLIKNATGIGQLAEDLEVRYLANRDPNIYFALLTDFHDAPEEHMPDDETVVLALIKKIIELNIKYKKVDNEPFFLFHRARKWNTKDKVWMGYERKRGKLGDLNAFLRGHGKNVFAEVIGNISIAARIKYIITLDTDTQLPLESAWKMIGTMDHPLNQPEYNEKKKRVTEGYSILQPRVSNNLPSSDSSLFARLHSNDPGTDPYTKATSDVYQDLFGEGSYIGKGIYHIDAFELALKNRFPENHILSHDLLEGTYARAGLITDVQLYEEYPMKYDTDMLRRHRWIRGDWQIGAWVLPFVPEQDNNWYKNPLTFLSRWKIFDNIRRSLVTVSLGFLLCYGWIISQNPFFWTTSVTLIIVLPSILNFFWELFSKPKDIRFVQQLFYTIRASYSRIIQQVISLTLIPYEAFVHIDAILRTLWRMLISHQKLLEWTPYNSTLKVEKTLWYYYKMMWIQPVMSILVFSYLSIIQPGNLLVTIPFLIFWSLGPAIAWSISQPSVNLTMEISEEKRLLLRILSRKIWSFFEKFVSAEDNWLPPDNYQEEPVERIAHRTSPTNIGLYMLSNLGAYDLGYITAQQLLERTSNTLQTLQKMERYSRHFYNWYDTVTLTPLFPRYISTVDSGNMAGHLIILKQGLTAIPGNKLIQPIFFEGLIDTVEILMEYVKDQSPLQQYRDQIKETYDKQIQSLRESKNFIELLETKFIAIFSENILPESEEENHWRQKILHQLTAQKNLITSMAPWLIYEEVPEKFSGIVSSFPTMPSFKQLAGVEKDLLQKLLSSQSKENSPEENEWLTAFGTAITEASRRGKEFLQTIEILVNKCMEFSDLDYNFLYDKSQKLLSVGFNTEEHRRDNSYYDLLASEARLTTYLGIAQGKLPQESWFALGRQLTNVGTLPLLLSWSGSMFEYLMPLLVMPTYDNTLLHQTYKVIVHKQIEYGKWVGTPWGISESGYNMVDANLNYQYKAFGVPGTGFKRGLGEDLVISPYSTIMALMVAPDEAYNNLVILKEKGFEGEYGYYEAIDYTAARLSRKQKNVIIKSYMAHHQGMSFLSLCYLLLNKPMQQRFEAEVHLKSAMLLLQERIPRVTTFYSPGLHAGDTSIVSESNASIRVLNTPNTPIPEIQLLSNGRYHVMVTNAGGGYTRWKNLAITRWREDTTLDNWGNFCYIRDLENNYYWSCAFQPSLKEGQNYEAVFSQGRAEFRRRDMSLETHTEIVVSPEDDIELKRIHITNLSRKKRKLEITSYAEIALAVQAADEMHPAFSNLFVQTTINEQKRAIMCTRRPRSVQEDTPWMFHLMKVHDHDSDIVDISYETDREKFIGRCNSIHEPQAMTKPDPLQNSSGSVLDPIVSIRYSIVLEGNESVVFDIVTGVAETKELCNDLIDKYQEQHIFNRVLELAWTHSQVILHQINATEADAQLYTRLAGSIIFSNSFLQADPTVLIKNTRGQSGLWSYGISGDIPIVLVQIEEATNVNLIKQMVQAHLYWRLKGLIVDLVIWNDDPGGYRQDLQNKILELVSPGIGVDLKDKLGGIFIRSADQITNEDRILFQTVARVVIADRYGSLEEQINQRIKIKPTIPYFNPVKSFPIQYTSIEERKDLQYVNGHGGFTPDGKEYVITINKDKKTPAPWINVLANPDFGSIVTESGQSYTWVDNAHEIRLTPWNNDPVTDLKGEAFYLKDEESGRFWSLASLPCPGSSPYLTRHGFGYSVFEHSQDGIYTEMTVFTDIKDSIKYSLIKIRNHSGRNRRISITGYVEWVLGDLRAKNLKHTITEVELSSGAILARNTYNVEFAHQIAFFDADGKNKMITGDRTEFLGRNGNINNPDGLNRARFSGKTGAGLDPCAAIQISIDIPDEEELETVFRLGCASSRDQAVKIIQAAQGVETSKNALQKVHQYWNSTLGMVQINTPDNALNIITNGWLNYQTIASRIWGRSGFYQSGGAFGFRDQLQDVLSIIHSQPHLVRDQILLCASRQFGEGDVQHWWHPPSGRGVRTKCSDDYLWLPYVASIYISTIGDNAILDEQINFIEGRLLNAGEDSYYDMPIMSDVSASLYQHCVKAIEHGLRFGKHGLPFIGSGDWNDGMDKVGEHGQGESVWLAFFLYHVLVRFADVALQQGDKIFQEKCKQTAKTLRENIQKNAWDGKWFLRAYFDDGTPLGSSKNEECKIDSIVQSWAVLSGAGNEDRTNIALQSADEKLVNKEAGIIQLFNPPFDTSGLNPGYIKGYVPGVRENGGQYTHAAIWLVMAFAAKKDRKMTWELLQMINPIIRSNSTSKIGIYKTEPYVIAADVYAEPKHKGRGGWTWYTGSAGWMYQLILHSFIGLKRKNDQLIIEPCLPEEWKELEIYYNFLESRYHIHITQILSREEKPLQVLINNKTQRSTSIPLINDGKKHEVKITIFIVGERV
ncbi:MAG: glucoamylase family protein [Saprospiraceae bacterium]